MNRARFAPFIAGLSLCSMACDLPGSSSSSVTITSNTPSANAFDPAQIQGTWVSSCAAVTPASGMSAHSLKETLSFVGTTFTITDVMYSDSLCTTVYLTAQQVTAFTLGGGLPGDPLSRALDVVNTYVHYTPNSPTAVSDLNAASLCALTGWASGTERDITGRTCAGSAVPAAGAAEYSFAQVVGVTRLYMGTPATSASTRPSFGGPGTTGYTKQ